MNHEHLKSGEWENRGGGREICKEGGKESIKKRERKRADVWVRERETWKSMW